jgi:hypothetical protein
VVLENEAVVADHDGVLRGDEAVVVEHEAVVADYGVVLWRTRPWS